ncbi:MAG: hypothetical protein D6729_16245 [Deltaproteobacteria bacterium]|nr:MAG: hypothetical protein D6729_16245 [Deltaproteobacteria bacterium]
MRTRSSDAAFSGSLAASLAAHPRLATVQRRAGFPTAAAAARTGAAALGRVRAPALARGLEVAAAYFEGLAAATLPSPREAEVQRQLPPPLSAPVTLEAGLRPLVGELAWWLLERGRAADASCLFATLVRLAPESAAGAVGLAALFVAEGDAEAALAAARAALRAEPGCEVARALLTEAHLVAGRREAAGAVLRAGGAGAGAVGSWLRLLRLGVEEGWLALTA